MLSTQALRIFALALPFCIGFILPQPAFSGELTNHSASDQVDTNPQDCRDDLLVDRYLCRSVTAYRQSICEPGSGPAQPIVLPPEDCEESSEEFFDGCIDDAFDVYHACLSGPGRASPNPSHGNSNK